MIQSKCVGCGCVQQSTGFPICEATPGNLDIQSHLEHDHVQIDCNEVVALGLLAGMDLPDVCCHHREIRQVGQ